jgi:lysophospholipase L1-like esterase
MLFAVIIFSANISKPTEKIVVYTIGDSMMANKDTTNGNPERGWVMMFQPFFDENYVVVENHARGGRSTKSFFNEDRWKTVVEKLKSGDYVFIQFGHNDQKIEDTNRYTEPNGLYREFLTLYVNETRAKGANPVLLTPIARRQFEANGERDLPENTHRNYAEVVRELAKTLDVPLIDSDLRTRNLLHQEGRENSKRFYMILEPGQSPKYPEGRQDNTHLNELGAIRVTQFVVEDMQKMKLPLVKYLT